MISFKKVYITIEDEVVFFHQIFAKNHRQEFIVGDLLNQSSHDVTYFLFFFKGVSLNNILWLVDNV